MQLFKFVSQFRRGHEYLKITFSEVHAWVLCESRNFFRNFCPSWMQLLQQLLAHFLNLQSFHLPNRQYAQTLGIVGST